MVGFWLKIRGVNMKTIITLILILVLPVNASESQTEENLNNQLQWTKPYCLKPGPREYVRDLVKYTRSLLKTFENSRENLYLIWNKSYLEKRLKLNEVIQFYINGHIGQQARNAKLEDMSVEQIHKTLVGKGFFHKRVPLIVSVRGKKKRVYLDRHGCYLNKDQDGVIYMDMYIHTDGSLIRVKPQGIPGFNPKSGRSYRQARPEVTRSVLLELNGECNQTQCSYDYSFKNEAFKITPSGFPIPKLPNSGLRPDILSQPKFKQKMIKDIIMSFVHLDIDVKCETLFPRQAKCSRKND